MRKLVYSIIIVFIFFVFCDNDKSTVDKNFVDLEEDIFLLEMKGIVIGSTGHYTLRINRENSFLSFYFNDSLVELSNETSFELANSLELTNEYLTFEASLDRNGNPNTNVEIPSHNREVATTAVISEIGEQNPESTSFFPTIDPSMANYNGTIEGKLSVDNGNSYRDEIVKSSTYNLTINQRRINGFLKCNSCLDDSIYNVAGFLSEDNETHVIFTIESISNRMTGEEMLLQPKSEQYVKHSGGLLLEREEFQTIGIDSVIKSTIFLKYVN